MANRRCISTKIGLSLRLIDQAAGAQAYYYAAICAADDDGIFEIDYVKRLANRRKQDIEALIDKGLIAVIDDRSNIGYVVDWQSFNTPDARYSTPSNHRRALVRAFPNIKDSLFTPKTRNTPTDNPRINKYNINKDKRKQENTKALQDDFEALWRDYPRRERKQAGLKYYIKSRKAGATAQEIADGTYRYIEKVRREKRDLQYIKGGGNFFREELWREDHTVKRDPAVSDDAQELEGII